MKNSNTTKANTTKATATTKVTTTAQALAALQAAVVAYNAAKTVAEAVEISGSFKELVNDYNKASKLDVYAIAAADEHPIWKLADIYKYKTVSVKTNLDTEKKSGKTVLKYTAEVKDTCAILNLKDFIAWGKEVDRKLTAAEDWETDYDAAKDAIRKAWKSKFNHAEDDTTTVSKTQCRKMLGAALDKLVFIPNDKGENKAFFPGKLITIIMEFSTKVEYSKKKLADKKTIFHTCDDETFDKVFFDAIKNIVHEDEFEIKF